MIVPRSFGLLFKLSRPDGCVNSIMFAVKQVQDDLTVYTTFAAPNDPVFSLSSLFRFGWMLVACLGQANADSICQSVWSLIVCVTVTCDVGRDNDCDGHRGHCHCVTAQSSIRLTIWLLLLHLWTSRFYGAADRRWMIKKKKKKRVRHTLGCLRLS